MFSVLRNISILSTLVFFISEVEIIRKVDNIDTY